MHRVLGLFPSGVDRLLRQDGVNLNLVYGWKECSLWKSSLVTQPPMEACAYAIRPRKLRLHVQRQTPPCFITITHEHARAQSRDSLPRACLAAYNSQTALLHLWALFQGLISFSLQPFHARILFFPAQRILRVSAKIPSAMKSSPFLGVALTSNVR